MSCLESVSLGAYVLGALEPAERAAVERHLAECRSCRDEVVSFAPLPGLLRHTPFEEMPEVYGPLGGLDPVESETVHDPPFEPFRPRQAAAAPYEGVRIVPPQAPGDGGGGTGRGERSGRGERAGRDTGPGRSSRRRRILAVAAVFLAACASAVFFILGPGAQEMPPPDRPVPVTTLTGTDPDTDVSADAALTPKAWGTEIELKLSGLPKDVRCLMVVHERGGRTERSGSWASGHYGSSTIPASTSVNQQDITRIDIVSDEGDLLVSLPRPDTGGVGTD